MVTVGNTVTVTVPKGVTLSDISRLCAIFLSNPQKSYFPRDFKGKEDWDYGSVKIQLRRLWKYGIIDQLPNRKYILKDSNKAYEYLNKNSNTFGWASRIHPPNRIRAKAHDISIGTIDMSGEPIEWMLKMNMLTKPKDNDPAQNVGLRSDIAKKFNMRVSLKHPSKSLIYPKQKGWEQEFLQLFNWCNDFVARLKSNDLRETMGIAINYTDLQQLRSDLENIPFEEIKGLIIEHDGMKIQLCASQFKEGEICIHTNSIEETMSLADKITYGNRNLAQAMKETSLEKSISRDLKTIKDSLDELPRNLIVLFSESIKEAVKEGIKEGFNELSPIKAEDRKEMRYR